MKTRPVAPVVDTRHLFVLDPLTRHPSPATAARQYAGKDIGLPGGIVANVTAFHLRLYPVELLLRDNRLAEMRIALEMSVINPVMEYIKGAPHGNIHAIGVVQIPNRPVWGTLNLVLLEYGPYKLRLLRVNL
jgi:hypothetical protein